jgi:predicted transcriptional regulator
MYIFLPNHKRRHEMLTPCEVAVKVALPSVRAMLANELMSAHRLNQAETAKLIGISQPAVSLYQQKLRGNSINLENDGEIKSLVAKHAASLVNGNSSYTDHLVSFCQICKILRSKGYLCDIHKAFDPAVDTETCNFCKSEHFLTCP